MSQLKRRCIPIVFLFLFPGCPLFDSGTDHVVDDYTVTWIDEHKNRALYKGETLVPPYVFAVGYDSGFIFLKQHPLLPGSKEIIDTSVTNYYIIERTTNPYQDKPAYGPLTKKPLYRNLLHSG